MSTRSGAAAISSPYRGVHLIIGNMYLMGATTFLTYIKSFSALAKLFWAFAILSSLRDRLPLAATAEVPSSIAFTPDSRCDLTERPRNTVKAMVASNNIEISDSRVFNCDIPVMSYLRP